MQVETGEYHRNLLLERETSRNMSPVRVRQFREQNNMRSSSQIKKSRKENLDFMRTLLMQRTTACSLLLTERPFDRSVIFDLLRLLGQQPCTQAMCNLAWPIESKLRELYSSRRFANERCHFTTIFLKPVIEWVTLLILQLRKLYNTLSFITSKVYLALLYYITGHQNSQVYAMT